MTEQTPKMAGLYIRRAAGDLEFTRIGHVTFAKPVPIAADEAARITCSLGFNDDGSPYILDAQCVAIKAEEVDDEPTPSPLP